MKFWEDIEEHSDNHPERFEKQDLTSFLLIMNVHENLALSQDHINVMQKDVLPFGAKL